jgi:hypothetical protein
MTNRATARALAQVLRQAAEEAGRAPSILNTQPWRWRVRDDVLEPHADRTRQVTSIDPEGRLLTLSCGPRRLPGDVIDTDPPD